MLKFLFKGQILIGVYFEKPLVMHVYKLILGCLLDTTLTLKVQVALLPDPSVKVYVTWVVPTLKKVPG